MQGLLILVHAQLAQLDRALASGAKGRRFDSCTARHSFHVRTPSKLPECGQGLCGVLRVSLPRSPLLHQRLSLFLPGAAEKFPSYPFCCRHHRRPGPRACIEPPRNRHSRSKRECIGVAGISYELPPRLDNYRAILDLSLFVHFPHVKKILNHNINALDTVTINGCSTGHICVSPL